MTIPLVIILVNLVFSIVVLGGVLGLLVWSAATPGRNQQVGSAARIGRQPRPIESPPFGELGAGQRKAAT
jgi:hypothetical protein